MAYCQPEDINVGNLMLPEGESRLPFISEASEEIDAKLGWLYATPINVELLKYHEQMLLKTICRKIATGRMVTTLAIPEESGGLNAYGLRMIQEGLDELHIIACGDVPLSAQRADYVEDGGTDTSGIGAEGSRTPSVINQDSESLINGFNKTVYGGVPWTVEPDDLVL